MKQATPSTEPVDIATHDGVSGYWVQAECVFINTESPQDAIDEYRLKLSAGKIACSYNHNCDGIQRRLKPEKSLTAEDVMQIAADMAHAIRSAKCAAEGKGRTVENTDNARRMSAKERATELQDCINRLERIAAMLGISKSDLFYLGA